MASAYVAPTGTGCTPRTTRQKQRSSSAIMPVGPAGPAIISSGIGHSACVPQTSIGRGLGLIRADQPSPKTSILSNPRGAIPVGVGYEAATDPTLPFAHLS